MVLGLVLRVSWIFLLLSSGVCFPVTTNDSGQTSSDTSPSAGPGPDRSTGGGVDPSPDGSPQRVSGTNSSAGGWSLGAGSSTGGGGGPGSSAGGWSLGVGSSTGGGGGPGSSAGGWSLSAGSSTGGGGSAGSSTGGGGGPGSSAGGWSLGAGSSTGGGGGPGSSLQSWSLGAGESRGGSGVSPASHHTRVAGPRWASGYSYVGGFPQSFPAVSSPLVHTWNWIPSRPFPDFRAWYTYEVPLSTVALPPQMPSSYFVQTGNGYQRGREVLSHSKYSKNIFGYPPLSPPLPQYPGSVPVSGSQQTKLY